MGLRENIKLALRAIRANLLRTILTVCIIALGISMIVGILTCIDVVEASLTTNFTRMGANTFTIRNIRMQNRGDNSVRINPPIGYDQATDFEKRYDFPSVVSISTRATMIATVKYKSEKTNPNVQVMGANIGYLYTAGMELGNGRNFSDHDIQYGNSVIILGHGVKKKIFGNRDTVINSMVLIGPRRYKVIGVMEEKGSSMLFKPDNMVLIPLNNARKYYVAPNRSYFIAVSVADIVNMEGAIGEATGLFRTIRKLALKEESDFDIVKSDNLANELIENLSFLSGAATIIGFLTLLGAAIALMNILLVSVKERTREIGVSKAIGATSATIKWQFLVESIVICQIGGVLGILGGLLLGLVVAVALGGSFVIPWGWMISGVVICFVVGISAGMFPAIKASKLDPIVALRYE